MPSPSLRPSRRAGSSENKTILENVLNNNSDSIQNSDVDKLFEDLQKSDVLADKKRSAKRDSQGAVANATTRGRHRPTARNRWGGTSYQEVAALSDDSRRVSTEHLEMTSMLDILGATTPAGTAKNSRRRELGGRSDKDINTTHGFQFKRQRPFKDGYRTNMRAAFIMFGLIFVFFVAFFEISAAAKYDRVQQQEIMRRYHAQHQIMPAANYFEEGVDRPVSGQVANILAKKAKASGGYLKASKMQSQLAKVPKGPHGPEEQDIQVISPPLHMNNELVEEKNAVPELSASSSSSVAAAAVDKLPVMIEETNGGAASDKLPPPTITNENFFPEEVLQHLSPISEKDPGHQDLPMFWHIPRSGGGIVRDILSSCDNLVLASEAGGRAAAGTNTEKLEVVQVSGHPFLNVDMASMEGLKHAKAMSFAESGTADVVVSPKFLDACNALNSRRGRFFTMLRHPVERAVSMYLHLYKRKHPEVSKLSLEDYSRSKYVENNWMVRFLTNTMSGPVNDDHLEVAKDILRQYVVVGLLTRKEESMKRFEHYFGWDTRGADSSKQQSCRKKLFVGDMRKNELAKTKIEVGSQTWEKLLTQNRLDTKLFQYAQHLYLIQGSELFSDVEVPGLDR